MTEVNLPVYRYYEKDFVDPLYSPYIGWGANSIVPPNSVPQTKNGYALKNPAPVLNDCKQLGACGIMVNPNLVRNGWHQSFQKMYANRSCPTGWTPSSEDPTWCVQSKSESNGGTFYTQKMYQQFHLNQSPMEAQLIPFVEQQFFTDPDKKPQRVTDSKFWDQGNKWNRQVTGIYDNPSKGGNRYKTAPAKDSYLA